ncbi:MAG: aldehyde dehydrogenase EutE [Candidatus Wallbacteria bacterium]|nr:aldehyde dehydrogenase EutE [Candidatus Wallbacteria bacterium]
MAYSELSEHDVKKIVEQVVFRLKQKPPSSQAHMEQAGVSRKEPQSGNGLFAQVDDAYEAASVAFRQLTGISLKKREEIISAFKSMCRKEVESLARAAVEETGFGRVEDKIKKNVLAIEKTPGPECIQPRVYTGDHGLTLEEYVPYGVIATITPSTNPAATVINNSISMVSAGNTVVFNCHPSARKVSLRVIELMNEASISVGGPVNIVTGIADPTMETSKAVMNHKKARLVVVTGGEAVVREAFRSGKKVLAAGPGNPPVVVDETANLEKAGSDIVNGASFDNGVLCTAEKAVIAVASIADGLKDAMRRSGAYELKGDEIEKLSKVILNPSGGPNRKLIGRNAAVILREIGIHAGDNIRLVLCEVNRNHPLVTTEQLMPVLPFTRVKTVDEAIDLACEVEGGNLHTAIMHSLNIDNLHRFARQVNTTIFVKNGPSYSGLGFNGEGYATLTICTPTGEGLTAAKTFTRQRRCVMVDYFRIV